jgi:tRNA (guanosine-2'-O-)-methyltransferase
MTTSHKKWNDSKWMGSTDKNRLSPLDYFIPESLQGELGEFRNFIAPFVTEQRILRMETVLEQRTRCVLPIFENTHHTHNVSAVMRTMDAMGFQDLVQLYSDSEMRFRLKDTVERGSSHWLNPRRGQSLLECVSVLKKSNYLIGLVTLPTFFRTSGDYSSDLPSFSSNEFQDAKFQSVVGAKSIALVFGNEADGVEAAWKEHADFYVHVDMFGFVESLNMSVCAGILFSNLRSALQGNKDYRLSSWIRALLLDHWLAKDTQSASELVQKQMPGLWAYFEFVKRGRFFDPFDNLATKRSKASL